MINTNIEFAYPWFLLLLFIIPIFIILKYKKKNEYNAIKIPNIKAFQNTKDNLYYFRPLLFWMRLIVISLLIIALARPRNIHISQTIENKKGIDIILTVDVSLSMLAKDLNPDRLEALKKTAENFVEERKGDRIGLIAYSGEALTLVPLTIDKDILKQKIKDLNAHTLEGGTAIGVGLATAINHLKNSKAKSKIIILMTDGVNNDGFIDPNMAADIAADKGIKVYTIGIGTNGWALFPKAQDPFTGELYFEKEQVEIDEALLQYIAKHTGGKYFRATNTQSLNDIYESINHLEKSEISDIKYYNYIEKYRSFLIAALIILLLELFLRCFVFRSIN